MTVLKKHVRPDARAEMKALRCANARCGHRLDAHAGKTNLQGTPCQEKGCACECFLANVSELRRYEEKG